jgi:hypothetical protein
MVNLKRGHNELFRRSPDECFESLPDLLQYCQQQKEQSADLWKPPQQVCPDLAGDRFGLKLADDGEFLMNDWSFTQLCGLARVNKDTVNRLTPETAARRSLPVVFSGIVQSAGVRSASAHSGFRRSAPTTSSGMQRMSSSSLGSTRLMSTMPYRKSGVRWNSSSPGVMSGRTASPG